MSAPLDFTKKADVICPGCQRLTKDDPKNHRVIEGDDPQEKRWVRRIMCNYTKKVYKSIQATEVIKMTDDQIVNKLFSHEQTFKSLEEYMNTTVKEALNNHASNITELKKRYSEVFGRYKHMVDLNASMVREIRDMRTALKKAGIEVIDSAPVEVEQEKETEAEAEAPATT